MALSDKWTRATIRTAVRNELLDPAARWWSDAKVNDYIEDWQRDINNEFEFVWAVTTLVTAASTIDVETAMPNNQNVGRVYADGLFLPTLSRERLDVLNREWREPDPLSGATLSWYAIDQDTIGLQPAPTTTHTYIFEYPVITTFTGDSTPMIAPAWTRYSSIPYCAWRAYLNLGPNHDLQRAARYQARYTRMLKEYRRTYDGYFPHKYPYLKPAGILERELQSPHGYATYLRK